MEPVLAAAIAILVLLGGTATILTRQRMLPWSLPAFRASADNEATIVSAGARDASGTRPIAAAAAIVEMPTRAREERAAIVETTRLDVAPDPFMEVMARLERVDERLDALARMVERQGAEIRAELHLARSDLAGRAETEQTQRDAAMERLRTDMLTALSGMRAARGTRSSARRMDVVSELYARLARLEAGLAAVTNPVLLPGEAYAPPADFLPEALVWENWNEVGERAFALADAYSAQRIHLSEQTCADVGGFVTSLRTLLTRSVYPNLQPDPDAAQQAALRGALEKIAVELPSIRATLEREYRDSRPT